jgi:hypothetical protein
MNEKHKLLAEILGDGDGGKFACIAAAHTRRRREAKKLGATVLGAATVIVALMATRQATPELPSLVRASPLSVEIISDEELLAQLKHESVLILKDRRGISGIVFLAESPHPPGDGW